MGTDLDKLEKKLKEARKNHEQEKPEKETDKNLSAGARAGVELVGAILGGGLIGYLLDSAFSTKPAFLIVFILLGVCTGFYNVYRITNNLGSSVGYGELHHHKKDAKQAQQDNTNDV